MAIGTGKYDEYCTAVREETGAYGAILMILDGDQGHGFAVQLPPEVLGQLPEMLRHLATSIENQVKSDVQDLQMFLTKDQ